METVKRLPDVDWEQQAAYARSVQEIQAHNKRVDEGRVKGEKQAIPLPPEGWLSKAQAEKMIWEKMNELVDKVNEVVENSQRTP